MGKMRRSYGNGGFSFSVNAMRAIDEGRESMTHAKRLVAKQAGVTQRMAMQVLNLTHDGEWHHVSKYANKVHFYDVREAVKWARLLRRYSKQLKQFGTTTTGTFRNDRRRIIHCFFADEKGVTTSSVPFGNYGYKKLVIRKSEDRYLGEGATESSRSVPATIYAE
jgi:predicted RNA-binding protein Jag